MTMRGRLARCWLFGYETDPAEARALVPAPLEPVVRDGRAFWNLVICRVEAMRPRGLPAFTGMSYWHVAYRLQARLGDTEGLFFVRSDCDSRLMSLAGNLMTDYRFHSAGITVVEKGSRVRIAIDSAEAPAEIEMDRAAAGDREPAPPYRPFGLSVDGKGRVTVVKIVRDEAAWKSRPVRAVRADWEFMTGRPVRFTGVHEVEAIEYRWCRAKCVESST